MTLPNAGERKDAIGRMKSAQLSKKICYTIVIASNQDERQGMTMIKTVLNMKHALFAFLLALAAAVSAAVTAQSSNSIVLDTSAYDIAVCVSEDWVEPLITDPAGSLIIIR